MEGLSSSPRRPRVSVVVPVRDDADLLRTCLTSLAAQTVAPWEVVVVDNGSSDDTAAVAREHGARVVPEPVRGVPAAAARGYDSVTGEVIARCDADSVLPCDWVERIARAFAQDPALDAVTGPGVLYGIPRWAVGPATAGYLLGAFGATGAAVAGVPLWGSNLGLRRSSWERVRHLVRRDDPLLHDDLDLTLALGPRARVRFDPRLRVRVAGRILDSPEDARRRVAMAMRTLRRGWAQGGSAGLRWMARLDLPVGPGLPTPPPPAPVEEVVLLDPEGRAIGTAPKAAVHHETTPLHLAFSCYVLDDDGRVLLSRRAWHKATFPGVVTNSVCGHPAPGELLEDAVRRRARDELGLDVQDVRLVLPGFGYRAEQGGVVEHELCPVLVARPAPGATLDPDPDEVDGAWWQDWDALRAAVATDDPALSPWCREQVPALAALGPDPRDWPTGDPAGLPPAARQPA